MRPLLENVYDLSDVTSFSSSTRNFLCSADRTYVRTSAICEICSSYIPPQIHNSSKTSTNKQANKHTNEQTIQQIIQPLYYDDVRSGNNSPPRASPHPCPHVRYNARNGARNDCAVSGCKAFVYDVAKNPSTTISPCNVCGLYSPSFISSTIPLILTIVPSAISNESPTCKLSTTRTPRDE